MKAILFGATGMVGQGVLRECLLDEGVTEVLSVGRSASGQTHPKLRELVLPDLFEIASAEASLSGYDACFYCLGVASGGLSEAQYSRITYELALRVAEVIARKNPQLTFVFISGAGTDATERGRTMWARVKGRAENALAKLPFKAAYMFRPGGIRPIHGEVSKTPLYRKLYRLTAPVWPVLERLFPGGVTNTEKLAPVW